MAQGVFQFLEFVVIEIGLMVGLDDLVLFVDDFLLSINFHSRQ